MATRTVNRPSLAADAPSRSFSAGLAQLGVSDQFAAVMLPALIDKAPVNRATIAAWRVGKQPVPAWALLALWQSLHSAGVAVGVIRALMGFELDLS